MRRARAAYVESAQVDPYRERLEPQTGDGVEHDLGEGPAVAEKAQAPGARCAVWPGPWAGGASGSGRARRDPTSWDGGEKAPCRQEQNAPRQHRQSARGEATTEPEISRMTATARKSKICTLQLAASERVIGSSLWRRSTSTLAKSPNRAGRSEIAGGADHHRREHPPPRPRPDASGKRQRPALALEPHGGEGQTEAEKEKRPVRRA